MSKPNRYRTDKDDDRETEPSRKGHHGLALLILILLAGVVVWFWLARDPEAREEFSNRMANLRIGHQPRRRPDEQDNDTAFSSRCRSRRGKQPARSAAQIPFSHRNACGTGRGACGTEAGAAGRSRSTRPCGPRRTGSSRCGAQGRSSRAHRLYRRFGFMARFPLCPRSDPGPERKAFRKPAGSKSPLWNGDDRPRMDRR